MQSDDIFPALIGRDWTLRTRPIFKTGVQQSQSLREVRISYASAPVYGIKLGFEFLRAGPTNGNGVRTDLDVLQTFFHSRFGRAQTFLLRHWYDNTLRAEPLGVGDGVTRQFALQRQRNGVAEPVWWLDADTAAPRVGALMWSGTPLATPMWINAYALMWSTAYSTTAFTVAGGVVTFATAPPAGSAVLFSGAFFYRCRFDADELDFENFLQGFWKTSLELRGTLGNKL